MNRRNRNKSRSDHGKPTFKATAKAKAFSPRKTRLSKNDKKKLVEAVKAEVAESSKSKPKEKKRGNATTQNTMNLRLTEHGAGITEYISKHEGFSAIIKQRYSDFHVNEIDCDGNVVTLTTLEAPEAPVAAAAETKEDIDDYLKTTLSEEQYKTLMEIVDSNGEEVEIEATDMSKEDRRKLHTAIVKCGKSRLISNTVDKDGKKYIVVKRSSKAGKQERRSVPWPADRGGEYVYFILHKENMDTMETVNLIASRLRVKPNLITYAGMKDRRAKTSQLMCVWKVEPQRLVNVSRSLRGIEMGNYSFHQRPLRLGDLRGNRFRIVLRNVTGSDKQIEDGLTSLKTKGFLNYYGLQRFGSSLAVPTHEIGKALLLGNWQKAVELILKPRDGEPLRFLAEARKVWWETRDPAKAIKILRNKDKMIEGKLLLGLSRHGPKNYLNALDNIPRGTRLMYLHSYQSLIWNKVVSRRMQKFGLQPIVGDLVLQGEERAEPVELLEVGDHDATATQQTSDTADDNASNRQKPSVRILSESDVKDFTIYDIVLPLPGHDVVYPQNETKEWFEELLQADGLSPAKLKQSVRAYSVGGAYRHIAVRPTNVSWKIMHYSDPQTTLVLSDLEEMQKVTPPEDEKDGVYKALILDFCLPSSTYATMAVREVLKSDTSCYSQALLNDYHVPTGPNGTPKRRLSSAENGDSASSSVSEDVKTEPQDQVTSTKHQVSSICTRATKREKKTTDSDGQMEIESKPGGETPEPSASEVEEKDEPSSEVTTETAVVLPLHPTLHSEEIIPMDVDKNVQSVTPSEYGIISKSSLTEKSALDIEVAVAKIEDAVQCEPNTTNMVPQASNAVSARQEQLHAATDATANLSASAETKLGLARELSDIMGKKEVSSKFVDVFPQSVQNTTVLPPEKTSSISNTSAELITSSTVPLCVEPILTSEALMSQAITSTKDKVPDQQNVTRISPLTASATIIDEGKFPKDTVAVPLPSDDVEMSKPNINPVDNSLEPSDGSPCNIRKTLQHETETSSARVCLQTDSLKHVSSSDRMDTNLETVHVVLSTSEIAPMSPVMTVASSKIEEIKALEELKAQGVVPHEETTAEIAASSAITENKGTLPAEDHWSKKELLGDRKPAVSSDKPENEKTECKNILMATPVSVKATLSPSESDEVCEETSQVAIEGTIISDGAVSTPNAKTDSEVGHENVEQVKRIGDIVLEKGNKAGSESLPKMGVHQTHSRPEPLTQPESALSVASNVTKNLTNAKTEVEELQMPEVAFCSDKLSGASVVGTDKTPSSINTHTSKAVELSKETANETGTAMLDLKELAHSQADETLVAERTLVSDDEAEVKSEEPKLCTVSENNLTTSQTVTETLEVTRSSETAQSMKALTKSSNKSTVVSSHSEAETSVVDAESKVVTSTVEIVSEKLESMVPPLNQFTGEQVTMASEGTEQEMKTTGLQIPRGTTEVPGVPGLDITPPAVLSSQISQNMMLKLEKDQKETETPVSETEILQQVDRCLETKEPSNMCVDKNELESTSSKALKTTVEPNKLSGIEMPLGRTSLTADVQEIEAPHTPAVKSEESAAHASDQLSEQEDCGGKRKVSQERSSEQAVKSEVTKQTVTDVPSVLDCEIPKKMIECVHAETSSNKEQGQNAQKTLIAPELASSSVHESSEIVKDSVTQLDSSCAMPEVETAFTSESETSTRSKLVATIEMEEERQMIVVQINKSGEVEQPLKGNDTQSVKVSCVESEKRLASQQAILEKTEKSLQSSEVPTSTGLISEELFVRKTADDTSELSGKASVNQGSVSISITPRSSDETSLFEKVATKEIGNDGISASQNSLTAKNKASVDCSTSEFVPEKTNPETAKTETAGEILLQSSDLIKTSEHHFMKEKTSEETVELCAASKKFKGTELCLAEEDVPDCDKKVDQKLAKQEKIQDTPTNVDSVLLSTSLPSSVEEKVIENSESSLGTAGNHLSQSAASEESKPDVKCVSSEDDGNSCEKEDTEKNQTHSPTSDPLAKENESDSQAHVKHKVNSDTDSERTEVSIKRKVWESENETEVSPKKVKIDDCNIGMSSSISDAQCSKSPESLKRKSASDDAETGDQESNTEKKKPKVETSEQ
ncbi:uncharacterized protein LOC126203787 [Schistocerca nitens]|uniref:uncharacterized protein LOC126203787 n=1 Tax=Schistocerca nitens TaxID=7011 RepID=UPI002117D0A7|nr:uncharacterized protein LOC126203787 [Schistocerca nitens]